MDTHINTQTQAGRQRLIISATLAVCTVVLIEAFKRIASADTRRLDGQMKDELSEILKNNVIAMKLWAWH